MEKYREFIEYGKVSFYKTSVLKILFLLIILFGSMSFFVSAVESEGLIVVILINLINISIVLILKFLISGGDRKKLHLFSGLAGIVMLLCFFEGYYCIITDYKQIPIFRGLIYLSGKEMLVISMGICLVLATLTIIFTKKKINNRWYKDRYVKTSKSLSKSTIVSLGVIGSVAAMNTKGVALLAIAFLTLSGIFMFYIVQYFMRYYYVKKYSLADAINMVDKAPEDSRVG